MIIHDVSILDRVNPLKPVERGEERSPRSKGLAKVQTQGSIANRASQSEAKSKCLENGSDPSCRVMVVVVVVVDWLIVVVDCGSWLWLLIVVCGYWLWLWLLIVTVVVVVSLQYATNICTLLQYSHSHFKFVLPGFDNDCVKQSWFECGC